MSTSRNTPDKPPPMPFQLSEEDRRLIEECNREAFYQRCLPCATVFAGLTYGAVRTGYLKPNKKWGPAPKVVGAAFLGYIIGKISYHEICAEKLMANPNSEIGAVLRERRRQGGGGFQNTLIPDLPGLLVAMKGSTNDYADNLAPKTFNNINTDRSHKSLDDTSRPA